MENYVTEEKSNNFNLPNWEDITKKPHLCSITPSLIIGSILLFLSITLIVMHFISTGSKPLNPEDPQTVQALSKFLDKNPNIKPLIITENIEIEKIGNIKEETLYFVKFNLKNYVDKLILQVDTKGKLYYSEIGNNYDGKIQEPTTSFHYKKWSSCIFLIMGIFIPLKSLILIKTISYTLQDYSLYKKSGILVRKKVNVNLIKYVDHNSKENIIENIFNCATIIINSKDEDTPILKIKSIKNAESFEKEIYDRAMIARAQLVRRVDYDG